MVLLPLIALVLGAPACDVLVNLMGGGDASGPAAYGRGGVYLQLENQSGFRVAIEATYSYDGTLVRQTTRWLPASGPEASETVLLTDADQITVTAYAAETVTGIVQEGDVLAQNHYVLGKDYLAGGTLVFEVPVVDTPPPSIMDCNQNGVADAIDIADGTSPDCDLNGIPDACDVADDPAIDCNHNGVPDACDIAEGQSLDRNGNAVPDDCEAPGLLLELDSQILGPEQLVGGKVWLLHPAGAGGTVVYLRSLNTEVLGVTPYEAIIPEGQYGANFQMEARWPGMTEVVAESEGLEPVSAAVTVTAAAVILPIEERVGPDDDVSLAVSLSVPAPEGGLTVTLSTDDPQVATVDATVFFPEGSRWPIADPRLHGVAFGTTTITATAPGFAPGLCDVTVTIDITFAPNYATVRAGSSVQLRLRLSAPMAGLTLHLGTDESEVATVASSVVTGACETCTVVTVHGLSAGTTTLRAWAEGIDEATTAVSVAATPEIVVGDLMVGDGLQTSPAYYTRWLGMPAGAGGVDVTFTSEDPTRLRLAADAEDAGGQSITVHVPAGESMIPEYFVQGFDDGLFNTQPVRVNVSAPGYNDNYFEVTLAPSGFAFTSPGDFTTTTLSGPQTIWVRPVCLDVNTFEIVDIQEIRGMSSPVGVPVSVDDSSVGEVSPDELVFYPTMDGVSTVFSPADAGDTLIFLGSPVGGAWQVPVESQQIEATVNLPTITLGSIGVGRFLQHTHAAHLRRLSEPAPAGGTVVSLVVDNPAKVKLSTDATTLGGDTLQLDVVEGQTQIPPFYVQGLASSGSTTITATATGYAPTACLAELYPSGFYIASPTASFETTPLSEDTSVTIRVGRLDPETYAVLSDTPPPSIKGGFSTVSVSMVSSLPPVGAIVASPAMFSSGDSQAAVGFSPNSIGHTTISLTTPAAFTTPTDHQDVLASVTEPVIDIANCAVGKDLQALPATSYRRLSTAAPAGGVDVTLTSGNPAKVLLSDDAAAAGTETLVLHVPEGSQQIPPFYIQGLADHGTVLVSEAANGFSSSTFNVTLKPSGFAIGSPNWIGTTAFSDPTQVVIRPARLSPATRTILEYQRLRGGMTDVEIGIASSAPSVGTMTVDPVIFQAGMSEATSGFDPNGRGTAVVSIETPTGFVTPDSRQAINASVEALAVSFDSQEMTVGLDLQTQVPVYLGNTPPVPVDVTVTSCTDSIVTLSKDPSLEGTQSVTFEGVASQHVGSVYVQGRGLSCTRIVAEAAGYEDGRCHVTVSPSGFYITWPYEDFDVDVSDEPVSIEVAPAMLDLSSLFTQDEQEVRGGLSVGVGVTSSDTDAGLMADSPLMFEAGVTWRATDFVPGSVGSTIIALTQPFGFTMPANDRERRVEVVDRLMQGACCFSGDWCEVMPEDICVAIGGTYQGDGVSCDPNPCSQPATGACCLDGTVCRMRTEADCTGVGGIYVGDGTSCDDSPCSGSQPVGACCVSELQKGMCSVRTQAACLGLGGYYVGDGTDCDGSPCGGPQPVGACCLSEGGCQEMPEFVCIQDGGTFLGLGVQCGPATCD